jgi:hypothetical protein
MHLKNIINEILQMVTGPATSLFIGRKDLDYSELKLFRYDKIWN